VYRNGKVICALSDCLFLLLKDDWCPGSIMKNRHYIPQKEAEKSCGWESTVHPYTDLCSVTFHPFSISLSHIHSLLDI
jgi:hypothetical protein